jgi:hypothetical protein
MVLDADPIDPHAVTTEDLRTINPLLKTAAAFHALASVESEGAASSKNNLVTIHVTHRSPSGKDDGAAYITLVPGDKAQLWVGSGNGRALDLAVKSISDDEDFLTHSNSL